MNDHLLAADAIDCAVGLEQHLTIVLAAPVSYTHLDVYKRQVLDGLSRHDQPHRADSTGAGGNGRNHGHAEGHGPTLLHCGMSCQAVVAGGTDGVIPMRFAAGQARAIGRD